MSAAGLIMDLMLAVLLVAALAFGFRLERKLKALREGQAGFAAAVRELDGAARRAETGLASLREATDEAHDSLHDRILKARELKTQLETLIARAERMPLAAARAAAEVAEAPVRLPPPAQGGPLRREAPTRPLATAPGAPSRPLPPRRIDEDLFESAGDRR